VTFRVRLTREAEADLDRLFDFVLERELERDGGDLSLAEQAVTAIRAGFATLKNSPFTCRKAGQSPFLRELIIPFGRSGYVALIEIESVTDVAVVAVRHQLEDDYH
jgi:plasmid stabilization system protein ParE